MPPLSLTDMLRRFGKEDFRPMQRELMECALRGESCIGILPTGSGKSLCYQIPAVMLPGVTLVVSPLIALMRDQVGGLRALGVSAAGYDSTLSDEEKEDLLAALKNGALKLLFAAPESLESAWMQKALKLIEPGMFVVDEAHCISEWGHSFRPDYLGLPDFYKKYGFKCVMALTATAAERVCRDLAERFGVHDGCVFRASPYRGNILRMVESLPESRKVARLTEFLSDAAHRPAVVYARARKDAENLCFQLAGNGFDAKAYHAGMTAEARATVQDDFLTGKADVLVATIAFGMGIDKQDVRSVVHYHPPTSPEAYVQESGRAGRDGRQSYGLVMIAPEDALHAENRMRAALPDSEGLRGLLNALAGKGAAIVSLYEASTTYDVPEVVRDRILFELKRRRLIAETGSGHKYYKVKPLFALNEILYGRDQEECARLKWLDANREGEVADMALAFGMPWRELGAWLDELTLSGEWKVERRQPALELTSVGFSAPDRVAEFEQYYARALQKDMERRERCYAALMGRGCLNRWLDAYFGFNENTAPCGHCPACLGAAPAPVPLKPPAEMPSNIRSALIELVGAGKPALARPAQMRRFLLGVSSPAAMRARLWAHPLYGALSSWPWDDVWAEVKALY